MKRKREDDDQDAGEPRCDASHAVPSATTITDLPDELAVSVLSFFDYYDRSKCRPVCRGLLKAIDSMPPPPDLRLEIRLVEARSDDRQGKPWTFTCEKETSVVRVEVRLSNTGGTYIAPQLPTLRAIRPKGLRVVSPLTPTGGGNVHVHLLRHVSGEVGDSVTDLAIVGMASTPVIELQKAFLKFENVKKIHLSTAFPLVYAVSAATCLRNLTSVSLLLREEMVPEFFNEDKTYAPQIGLHLGALSSLPNLRELDVKCDQNSTEAELSQIDAVSASFMVGYASIPQLEILSSHVLDDVGDESREAFPLLLRRLQHLNNLSILYSPRAALWRKVHAVGGHNKNLQKLDVYFGPDISVSDLAPMVVTCNEDFPSLTELGLHINCFDDDLLEFIPLLSGLKSHGSLSVVKCAVADYYPDRESFCPKLQEELGKSIKVVKVPLYDFEDHQ